MNEYIDQYIEIRNYLLKEARGLVEVYFGDIWDPLCNYMVIKEVNKIIENNLEKLFSDFPSIYFPKCKFKIFHEEKDILVNVQTYFNSCQGYIFLGNYILDGCDYDMYCRKSFDPRYDYEFAARYGHDDYNIIEGSESAAADYLIGAYTPLAIAYELAIEESYIS